MECQEGLAQQCLDLQNQYVRGYHLWAYPQYISLWVKLADVTLQEDIDGEIAWNLTKNGQYSSKSAYRTQFFGATSSPIASSVWKIWTSSKIKFFSWLVLQNCPWTNDRLEKQGWPNCGNYPLCKRVLESIDHLLVHCRYTIRLWGFLKERLGIQDLYLNAWITASLHSWWGMMTKRKDLASFTLLVSWEVWNERNARVFKNKHAHPTVLFQNIKVQASLWVLAGDKCMSNLMPRE
jgi:hypothetical protein